MILLWISVKKNFVGASTIAHFQFTQVESNDNNSEPPPFSF